MWDLHYLQSQALYWPDRWTKLQHKKIQYLLYSSLSMRVEKDLLIDQISYLVQTWIIPSRYADNHFLPDYNVLIQPKLFLILVHFLHFYLHQHLLLCLLIISSSQELVILVYSHFLFWRWFYFLFYLHKSILMDFQLKSRVSWW